LRTIFFANCGSFKRSLRCGRGVWCTRAGNLRVQLRASGSLQPGYPSSLARFRARVAQPGYAFPAGHPARRKPLRQTPRRTGRPDRATAQWPMPATLRGRRKPTRPKSFCSGPPRRPRRLHRLHGRFSPSDWPTGDAPLAQYQCSGAGRASGTQCRRRRFAKTLPHPPTYEKANHVAGGTLVLVALVRGDPLSPMCTFTAFRQTSRQQFVSIETLGALGSLLRRMIELPPTCRKGSGLPVIRNSDFSKPTFGRSLMPTVSSPQHLGRLTPSDSPISWRSTPATFESRANGMAPAWCRFTSKNH
jgi:hypothetical protein